MRQHPASMRDEQRQQLEFFRCESDFELAAMDPPAIEVDRQIAARELAVERALRPRDRRSAARTRAISSSGPNGFVT